MSASRCIIIGLGLAMRLFGQYGLSQDGRTLEMPGRILAPTKDSDCDNYQAIWDQLHADLENSHQQCLDAHQGEKGNPNSSPAPNQPCSYSACQSLHTARGMVQDRETQMVAACRADLQAYKAEQAQQQALLQQQQQAQALRQQAQAQLDALQQKKRADMAAARQKIQDQLNHQLQVQQDLQKATNSNLNQAANGQNGNGAAVLDALRQTLAQKDAVNKAISDLQKPYTIVDADGNVTIVNNISDAGPNPLQGYLGAGAQVLKGAADAVISALSVGGAENPEADAVKNSYDAMQGLIKAVTDAVSGSTTTGLGAAAAAGLKAVGDDMAGPVSAGVDGTEAILKATDGNTADAAGSAIKAVGGVAKDVAGESTATNVTESLGGIVSGAATVAEGVEHLQNVGETAQTLAEQGDELNQMQQNAIAQLQSKSQSLNRLAQNLTRQAVNQQPIVSPNAPAQQDLPLSNSPNPAASASPSPASPLASQPSAPAVSSDQNAGTAAVLKAYSGQLNPPPTTINFGPQSPAQSSNSNVSYDNYDQTAIPDTIAFGVPQQSIALTSSNAGVTYCADQPNIPCQIDFGPGARPAQAYDAPVAPSNPPDQSRCDDLASQWDALIARIETDHATCLQTYGNGQRTQNEFDLSNSVCETRACQVVHNSRLRAKLMKNGAVSACRASVNAK